MRLFSTWNLKGLEFYTIESPPYLGGFCNTEMAAVLCVVATMQAAMMRVCPGVMDQRCYVGCNMDAWVSTFGMKALRQAQELPNGIMAPRAFLRRVLGWE